MRKIYVASSWRNCEYPAVLAALRRDGHEVYDFRASEFTWDAIDPEWRAWTLDEFMAVLSDPLVEEHFALDKAALDWCDCLVLLLPCGRSAHLEAGYCSARDDVQVFALLRPDDFVPELMYSLCDRLFTSLGELRAVLSSGHRSLSGAPW